MRDLPDILDLIGRSPREFGAVHAFFEAVGTADRGRFVASVLFQAAFHPLPAGGQLAFFATQEGAEPAEVGRFPLPQLPDGVVVRARFPFQAAPESQVVALLIDAPAPAEKAQRIRPAWKLHDTVELPKLSEMVPMSISGSEAVGLALGGVAGYAIATAFFSDGTPRANNSVKTYKAAVLPNELVRPISAEVVPPVEAPVIEELWRPGQPIPEPPPLVIPAEADRPVLVTSAIRRCASCGFEGSAVEYERARACPRCDEAWW